MILFTFFQIRRLFRQKITFSEASTSVCACNALNPQDAGTNLLCASEKQNIKFYILITVHY